MEWWILAGLLVIGAAAVVAARLRTRRRAAPDAENDKIYPLW